MKYKHRQMLDVPSKFQRNFLALLDGRTLLTRELKKLYLAVIADLGGVDNLSTVQMVLIERFCWQTQILRSLEYQIKETKSEDAQELISRHAHAVNVLIGMAKALGIERRAKAIPSLEAYIKSKDRQK